MNLQPGTKRVNVRATRRKMPDPDFLLLEEIIRYIINSRPNVFKAYWISQYYCFDYLDYKYKLTEQSLNILLPTN